MPDMAVLRIGFEGEWWAFEMSEFISGIDELYADIALLLTARELAEKADGGPDDEMLIRTRVRQLRSAVVESERSSRDFLRYDPFSIEDRHGIARPEPLQVLAIRYGSEGSFDFFGIGRFADALASFFEALLVHFGSAAEREAKKLENIKTRIALTKEARLSEQETEAYARDAALRSLRCLFPHRQMQMSASRRAITFDPA